MRVWKFPFGRGGGSSVRFWMVCGDMVAVDRGAQVDPGLKNRPALNRTFYFWPGANDTFCFWHTQVTCWRPFSGALTLLPFTILNFMFSSWHDWRVSLIHQVYTSSIWGRLPTLANGHTRPRPVKMCEAGSRMMKWERPPPRQLISVFVTFMVKLNLCLLLLLTENAKQ